MNTKMKRRLIAVTGLIVIVLIVILTVVGSTSAAKAATVSDAVAGKYGSDKIQVTGNVVNNSYSINNNVLTFAIYDKEGSPSEQLQVRYEGGVSATFGNDVTAICTGKITEDGVLHASELVTKCPSKYENATDALTVAQLLKYGDSVLNKPLKLTGQVKAGTIQPVGESERLVLFDADTDTSISIRYDGALSDDVRDNVSLVVTGSISSDGSFVATDVALKE